MAASRRAALQVCDAIHSARLQRNVGTRQQLDWSGLQQEQKRHATSSRIPGSARPSRINPRLPATSRRGGNSAATSHSSQQRQQQHELDSSRAEGVQKQGDSPSRQAVMQSQAHEVAETSEVMKRRKLSSGGQQQQEMVQCPNIESILGQDTLVVTRQVEMMNIFLGFEQSNRYALNTAQGQPIGYLAESEKGMLGGSVQRQVLRTHRPFEAQILDTSGNVILIIRRPFTFINSKIKIFSLHADTKEEVLIGEVHQVFHVIRRKYELFINRGGEQGEENMEQFAEIDEGLWAWEFMLKDDDGRPLGAISRNFRGFGRELFTDTGQYVLTFDPTTLSSDLAIEDGQQQQKSTMANSTSGRELITSGPARALKIQERAVALATAISADFDYFSRHSEGSAGSMMPWIWMGGGGGGGSKDAEPTPEAEGPPSNQRQDSSGIEASPPAPGSDGGLGPAVGTGVGYGMMGGGSQSGGQQPSPPPPSSDSSPVPPSDDFGQGQEDVWGSQDPWSEQSSGAEQSSSSWGWSDFFDGE